jgi:hypothetical protein
MNGYPNVAVRVTIAVHEAATVRSADMNDLVCGHALRRDEGGRLISLRKPRAAHGAKRPFVRKQHATMSELVDLYAVGGDGGCGQQERQSSENPEP